MALATKREQQTARTAAQSCHSRLAYRTRFGSYNRENSTYSWYTVPTANRRALVTTFSVSSKDELCSLCVPTSGARPSLWLRRRRAPSFFACRAKSLQSLPQLLDSGNNPDSRSLLEDWIVGLGGAAVSGVPAPKLFAELESGSHS